MNREIKFRAWDKEEKRFWTQEEMTEIGGFYYNYGVGPHKEEFELMQYTGLKDKNGKEIYEGDIIRWAGVGWNDANNIGVVEWVDETGYFPFTECSDNWLGGHECGADVEEGTVEIIGSIHENPNLLDNKQ